YNWGGAAGTAFWVDPAEEMIAIFMVQSIPHRTRLRSEFRNLVYQAMVETYQD
ncbi:MAG TPA: serine hydrolase, partial [Gammaproteobacteria bacterium]|nr:serine hydrolase [Gammaproteobacteria bacterium]